MENFTVNINGVISKGSEAKISVFDRGFLYGDSVYEATRTFDQKPFRITQHIDRLFESALKISLIPTLSKEQIYTEIKKTIQSSKLKNATLRIVLTRGTNSDLGLDPELSGPNNLVIFTKEIKANPASWLTDGVSMTFYQKKSSVSGALPKTGNYQENLLAHKHAHDLGFYDSFMVNPEGFVTEGTTSNAWIIKDSVVYTPGLNSGVLEGLSRKTLFEMQEKKRLPLKILEKNLTKEDFLLADECFITSTTRNLVPVTKIDQTQIGSGKPGHQTLELLKLYLSFVQSL